MKINVIATLIIRLGVLILVASSLIHVVSPATLSILKATADSRLTLFTCTGLFDKDRLVVVARQI